MTSNQDHWTLLKAINGLAQANRLLEHHFHELSPERRIKLRVAKAKMEWAIEHITERMVGRKHATLA